MFNFLKGTNVELKVLLSYDNFIKNKYCIGFLKPILNTIRINIIVGNKACMLGILYFYICERALVFYKKLPQAIGLLDSTI